MSTVRLRCVSSDVRTREKCQESAVQCVMVSSNMFSDTHLHIMHARRCNNVMLINRNEMFYLVLYPIKSRPTSGDIHEYLY